MHEFGHALGLEHSDVPGDIMYPTLELSSPEVKQIPSTYADFIYQVYQVPAKSDLSFYGSINSTKFYTSLLLQKYYYLNISFSVKNLGISASPQTDVAIFANGKLARSQTIPSIGPGSSYIMSLANIRTNDSFDSVELVIDASNIADELDKSNNNVTINLS
ncbi:matrixin family metalloprotease [archaeon]|nr:MAG: matrixin family metalloprotease [archaeon]